MIRAGALSALAFVVFSAAACADAPQHPRGGEPRFDATPPSAPTPAPAATLEAGIDADVALDANADANG